MVLACRVRAGYAYTMLRGELQTICCSRPTRLNVTHVLLRCAKYTSEENIFFYIFLIGGGGAVVFTVGAKFKSPNVFYKIEKNSIYLQFPVINNISSKINGNIDLSEHRTFKV